MRQVNGGVSFPPPRGSRTTELIQLKIGMFDYVQQSPTSDAKYGGRRTARVEWRDG